MTSESEKSDETLTKEWADRMQHHALQAAQSRRRSIEPIIKWGRLKLRAFDDHGEEDWWFASIAIPLIAATVAPLANVLSIAALVVSWRMNLLPGGQDACNDFNGDVSSLVPELQGFSFPDPHWCYRLNIVSLVAGFIGNLFLLANFTNRIRYIIALPVTIVLWYLATGILVGITSSMAIYTPPIQPCQTYTQGYWYAVMAAVLYCICSMGLMVNMLGYFLGHYPQHFNLTESQRTLILQTMMFFMWLAGGAGVFSRVEQTQSQEQWLFTDGLYFCDVTILTVGFGDLVPGDTLGRALVLPYAVGGIIMLGLMISSLTTFASEMSREKIINKRINNQRQRTLEWSHSVEQGHADAAPRRFSTRPVVSRPFNGRKMSSMAFPDSPDSESKQNDSGDGDSSPPTSPQRKDFFRRAHTIRIGATPKPLRPKHLKQERLERLREEKGRFEAMRHIQHGASNFKSYTALISSIVAVCLLVLVGAAVFQAAEAQTQGLTYFEAFYFCYISLLTIGYGDFVPKSNAGRPFFVLWSLLAVPTMTILVSHLGSTLIASFKMAISLVADFTVLPKYGVWRTFLDKHPWLLGKLVSRAERKAAAKRLEDGFPLGPDPATAAAESAADANAGTPPPAQTIEQLAAEEDAEDAETPAVRDALLARKLAAAVRRVAQDLAAGPKHRFYSYEEWVEITELIRFTSRRRQRERRGIAPSPFANDDAADGDDDDEGLIEWDWIGEDSPMMAGKSEPEFVMERLCESLGRFMAAQAGDSLAATPITPVSRRRTAVQAPECRGHS